MKNYKVGDMVYVKGTVGRTDDARNPCYVEFGYGVEGWIRRDNIIDELPTAEPVKPVLPKGVADELKTTKKLNFTFDGYIMGVIDNHYLYTNSHTFWMNSDDSVIKILMDAWYNGYTIEKPKLYNLVFGFDSYYKERVAFYKAGSHGVDITIDNETDDDSLTHDTSYQFTQEEIDKYNECSWLKDKIDLNKLKVEVKD